MNKPLSLMAVCLVVCSVGAGCKKKADFVGKWKFKDFNGTPPPGANKAALASAMLEFKPDNSFSLGGVQSLGGTYTFSDKTATMTIKTMMGQSIDQFVAKLGPMAAQAKAGFEKPMTATLADDGSTLTLGGVGGSSGSLIFAKDSSS